MIKKLFAILTLILILFFGIQSTFALQTYVGVKILNLSDDPTSSCAGQAGYGSQGRIRAISSLQPSYPLFFNLTYLNGTQIWTGNDTLNKDYTINDIIFLPQQVDLELGQQYKLFMDIDVIRIYLPLINSYGFTETADDNYWTGGAFSGTGCLAHEYTQNAGTTCTGVSVITNACNNEVQFISNSRNSSLIFNNCMSDGIYQNCAALGITGFWTNGGSSYMFNTGNKYANLHTSSQGNIIFGFTFT